MYELHCRLDSQLKDKQRNDWLIYQKCDLALCYPKHSCTQSFFSILCFSLTSSKILILSNSSCTFSPTGSPISTPSHSPLPRTPTTSTPVHSKQSSSSVLNNPYIIVDKPGQVIGMASSSAASTGTRLLLGVKVLLVIGSGPAAKWGSSVWATHIEFKNGCEDFTVQQNRSRTIPSRLYLYFCSFVLFYPLVLSYLALYSLPFVFSYVSLSSVLHSKNDVWWASRMVVGWEVTMVIKLQCFIAR